MWELGLWGKRPVTEQEAERAQAAMTARRRAAAEDRRRKDAVGTPNS
jgi:hypothetical protein